MWISRYEIINKQVIMKLDSTTYETYEKEMGKINACSLIMIIMNICFKWNLRARIMRDANVRIKKYLMLRRYAT